MQLFEIVIVTALCMLIIYTVYRASVSNKKLVIAGVIALSLLVIIILLTMNLCDDIQLDAGGGSARPEVGSAKDLAELLK